MDGMNTPLRRMCAGLLAVGALAAASAAAGTARVDMRDWYAPTVAGWTTAWEYEDGKTSTSEVLSVATVDGAKSVITRIDDSDGSFLETELVTYDGIVHYGTITSVVEGGAGVVLPSFDRGPTRLLPLLQRIGRTYRSRVIRGPVVDYPTGVQIGRFVRRERATLGGFEDKATPGGSYAGTLRQDWSADTRYFFNDKSELRITSTGATWYAVGQGAVAEESRLLIYHNRVLEMDSGIVAGWRTSVTAPAGVPFMLALFTPSR